MAFMQPKQMVQQRSSGQQFASKPMGQPNLAQPRQAGFTPPQQQGGWKPPTNAPTPVQPMPTPQSYAQAQLTGKALDPAQLQRSDQQATQMANTKQWQQAQAMPINRPSMLRPLG